MKAEQAFQQILHEVGQTFRHARPGKECPSIEQLHDYASGTPSDTVARHIACCDDCRLIVMRLEADNYFWNIMVEQDPEAALTDALGKEGRKIVRSFIKKPAPRSIIPSKIKDTMIAWASPLWQPQYAGQPVTAADTEIQSKRFEMEYGEYINLSCHWREEKDGEPYIDLSWQANLLQPSRLWARFIDPESSLVLTEILLGSDLEDKKRIMGSELNFNPATDKWAIAIIVEEK